MKRKKVIVDNRAKKDFISFDEVLREEFLALIEKIEEEGKLDLPEGKKMAGFKNLYEMRIILQGQWRGFYAYLKDDFVVVLHFTHKKTQKTALRDLETAHKRLKEYL
jgi:phage-related protein